MKLGQLIATQHSRCRPCERIAVRRTASLRSPRDPYAVSSIGREAFVAFSTTTASINKRFGGYGSLRSQGRHENAEAPCSDLNFHALGQFAGRGPAWVTLNRLPARRSLFRSIPSARPRLRWPPTSW